MRSLGVSPDLELSLPNEEVIWPRARITCQMYPRKLELRQEAELSSWDIQVA